MDAQREIAASYEAERALQRGWPDAIELGLFRQSTWYELPYAFLPAFPGLALHEVRELAVFGRLLANSIFLHDPLADRPVGVRQTAIATLRIMATQLEAYRALAPRVSAASPFWDRLRQYLADYASACVEELRFSADERPWRELTQEVAFDIAVKKSGPSRAIIAGLVALAGEESRLSPLLATLDHFNLACQMWDDLKDWRDDLARRMPTLLLSRVLPERPAAELPSTDVAGLAREIYRGGHAAYVVDLALASIDGAEALRPELPELPWWQLLDATRQKLSATRRDIDELARSRGTAVEPTLAATRQPKLGPGDAADPPPGEPPGAS